MCFRYDEVWTRHRLALPPPTLAIVMKWFLTTQQTKNECRKKIVTPEYLHTFRLLSSQFVERICKETP